MNLNETLRGSEQELAEFRHDVVVGLRQSQKQIPCKYFYDERGSELFEQICKLDEYYPTRTELSIMRRSAGDVAARLGPRCLLIELGSGSGKKTQLLLDRLVDPAGYVPVEIAREPLEQSVRRLARRYPTLDVFPVCADFTKDFALPGVSKSVRRRVVYFPGSTIGNFGAPRARLLLKSIARLCGPGGGVVIGVDLKKDTRTLERAYDDRRGVTAAFNLNLLARINSELGADFDLSQFRHRAVYNAEMGRIEMHLVSLRPQTVHIGVDTFTFAQGESIFTESSHKYDLHEFRALAESAGLVTEAVWLDDRKLFSVQYLEVS